MPEQRVRTRSQMYWNTLLKVPVQIVAFVVSLVVARILMPGDYGIMGIAMMLIGFANLFTDFGFSSAIVQKQIRDEETLQSIFTFNLVLSVILALLFMLSARFIAVFFKSPESERVVMVMSSVFIITSFSAVPRAILKRDINFRTLSLVDNLSAILMTLLTLLLALAHYRYWALALGQLIPMMASTVYVSAKVGWVPVLGYHHSAMKRIADFGMWNVLKTQLEFGLGQLDKMIVGRYSGVDALGFYDKGMSIAKIPNDSYIASVNAVLFSSFSQRRDDRRELQALFTKALMLISTLSFPVYIGLFIVSRYFVVALLGPKWSPMVLPFEIIAISFTARSLGGLVVAMNVAVGQYKAYTIRYFLAGCVFVVSCLLLAPYGPSGIAAAFLLFSVLHVGLGLDLAKAATALSWFQIFRACWPATKATIVMLVVTRVLSFWLRVETLPNLAGISVAGAIAYVGCLALETSTAFAALKKAAVSDLAKALKQDQRSRELV